MGNKKFFVSHNGVNMGPFNAETITQKLSSGELKNTDSIYLEDTDQWIVMSTHPIFGSVSEKSTVSESSIKVSMTPTPTEQDTTQDSKSSNETQWYVLKGKNRYGPFMFLDVIRMLQEKSVFEFDYIWRDGLESWKRLAETPEFETSKIRALLNDDQGKASSVFHRRRHRRFSYECPLVAHDNSQVWKGKTVELSEGGAGIVMENAMILPGQNVYIHFKPGPTSKPFNVLCEVVSKKYAKGINNKNASIVYGVKFINIHKQDSDEIKTIQVAA